MSSRVPGVHSNGRWFHSLAVGLLLASLSGCERVVERLAPRETNEFGKRLITILHHEGESAVIPMIKPTTAATPEFARSLAAMRSYLPAGELDTLTLRKFELLNSGGRRVRKMWYYVANSRGAAAVELWIEESPGRRHVETIRVSRLRP